MTLGWVRRRRVQRRRPRSGSCRCGSTRRGFVPRRSVRRPSRSGGWARRSTIGSISRSSWRASSRRAVARRALARMAMVVARCSLVCVGLIRRRAQRSSCSRVASPRSPSRSDGAADRSRPFISVIAARFDFTALSRVASSTRSASRSPRWRGRARCSRVRASLAARIASSSSDFARSRRAGRRGRLDFEHQLAFAVQEHGQSRAVAACSLDRPRTTARSILTREAQQPPVSPLVSGGRGLSLHDRGVSGEYRR